MRLVHCCPPPPPLSLSLRMSVGETARILIQPEWGYGANGSGPIPPNAVLTFEVELLAV